MKIPKPWAAALVLALLLPGLAACAGYRTARRAAELRHGGGAASMRFVAEAAEAVSRPQGGVPADAATDPGSDLASGVDPEALVALALARNPGLAAARSAWLAALEAAPAAASLPDPRLRVARMFEHVETRLGPAEGQLGLMQSLPFPGKLSLAGEVALARAQAQHAAYTESAIDVAARARRLQARLYALDRAIEVIVQQKALIERFAATAQTKYAAGTASQQDMLRAQVELSVLANRLVAIEQEREAVAAAINALVDRSPGEAVGPAAAMPKRAEPPAEAELYAAAEDSRPLLAQARHDLDRADKAARLARMEYLPDFELGAEYQAIGLGDVRPSGAGRDAWGLALGIRLPLGLGRIQASVAAAEAEREAVRARLAEVRNRVLFEVKDAQVRVVNGLRELDLYETSVLPVTEQALAVAETDYRDGKVDFLSLINLEKSLEQSRLEYYRAQSRLEEAWADLDRAVGASAIGIGGGR